MPKMVVGMNNRPEIIPQRIDCGLRNTLPNDVSSAVKAPGPLVAVFGASFGKRMSSVTLMSNPTTPA